YVEQQALYNAWNSYGINNTSNAAVYDNPLRYAGVCNSTVTTSRVAVYYCPSDGNSLSTVAITVGGVAIKSQNYAANYGNVIMQQLPITVNGVTYQFLGAPFIDIGSPLADITTGAGGGAVTPSVDFNSIIGGLSNTMLFSEILVGSGTGGQYNAPYDLRGFSWWAYGGSYSGFLTPNSTKPDWMQSQSYCVYPSALNPPCIYDPL